VRAKRALDLVLAGLAVVVVSPVLAVVAIGIRLGGGPGPVLYRAKRVGIHGRPFTMFKFRTMRVGTTPVSSVITAHGDPRIFPLGRLMRSAKLDELPQLFNILRGEMSIVGPRPEDPSMVTRFYGPFHYMSLAVLPGLTSPGSIYAYTHGEAQLDLQDAARSYGEHLLPIKMALDLVYVRRVSVGYDVALIARTAGMLPPGSPATCAAPARAPRGRAHPAERGRPTGRQPDDRLMATVSDHAPTSALRTPTLLDRLGKRWTSRASPAASGKAITSGPTGRAAPATSICSWIPGWRSVSTGSSIASASSGPSRPRKR
jgi:lipopolysaccharide/colanic/teichoic acid biosynthesis glycosyltransferase